MWKKPTFTDILLLALCSKHMEVCALFFVVSISKVRTLKFIPISWFHLKHLISSKKVLAKFFYSIGNLYKREKKAI